MEVVKERKEEGNNAYREDFADSAKAEYILEHWKSECEKFVKVYPREYHHIKNIEEDLAKTGLSGEALTMTTFKKVTEVS